MVLFYKFKSLNHLEINLWSNFIFFCMATYCPRIICFTIDFIYHLCHLLHSSVFRYVYWLFLLVCLLIHQSILLIKDFFYCLWFSTFSFFLNFPDHLHLLMGFKTQPLISQKLLYLELHVTLYIYFLDLLAGVLFALFLVLFFISFLWATSSSIWNEVNIYKQM